MALRSKMLPAYAAFSCTRAHASEDFCAGSPAYVQSISQELTYMRTEIPEMECHVLASVECHVLSAKAPRGRPTSLPGMLKQFPPPQDVLEESDVSTRAEQDDSADSLAFGSERSTFGSEDPCGDQFDDAFRAAAIIASVKDEPRNPNAGKKTLLLAYFPRESKSADFRAVFEKIGTIVMLNIVKEKCYAFLRFHEASAAQEAYDKCSRGQIIMRDHAGKAWHVQAGWANSPYGRSAKSGKRLRGPGSHNMYVNGIGNH
mmetsp:Transcript_104352/g.183923  ORF Transcript_104352/g.183923 Transcript_104352/m.183923 type:complete len:259 (+) Transcript_104352:130-906(+)